LYLNTKQYYNSYGKFVSFSLSWQEWHSGKIDVRN
jgi:hypothetical protein